MNQPPARISGLLDLKCPILQSGLRERLQVG